MPLTGEELTFLRDVQARLSASIARAAASTGTRFVPAAFLGAPHDACAARPWTNRFVFGDVTRIGLDGYHPNAAGNDAVADAVRVVASVR